MMFSQSIVYGDTAATLKLDYTSMIFVDPEVQINEILLDSYFTQTMSMHAIVYSNSISQGSVATLF